MMGATLARARGRDKEKKLESAAEQLAPEELVVAGRGSGPSVNGPNGLLRQLTNTVLETTLN
jgi:putative transposase